MSFKFNKSIAYFVFSIFTILISQFFVSFLPLQIPDFRKCLVICIFLILFFILYTIEYKKMDKLSYIAFITIFLFGIIFSLIKPVQFGLDEESHFLSTIKLSDSGIFINQNEAYPDFDKVNVSFDILRHPNEYKGEENFYTIEHQKSNISGKIVGINNLSFLPSAIGWKLGAIISKKIYISYFLGRIFNCLFYAILAALAIKISRNYKKVLFFISTLPFATYICASYQYDSLYFGLSLLIISLILNFYNESKSVGIKEICIFTLICFLFAFTKIPFILLGLLIVILPSESYKNASCRIYAGVAFIFELLLSFGYLILVHISHTSANIGGTQGLVYFIKHPFPIIRTLIDFLFISMNSISNPLQYIIAESRFMSTCFTIIFVVTIIFLSVNLDIKMKNYFTVTLFFLLFIITLLIIYAISSDSRVFKYGDLFVNGVQGRYYYFMILVIPIYISPALNKYIVNSSNNETNIVNYLLFSSLFLNVVTLGIAMYTVITHVL